MFDSRVGLQPALETESCCSRVLRVTRSAGHALERSAGTLRNVDAPGGMIDNLVARQWKNVQSTGERDGWCRILRGSPPSSGDVPDVDRWSTRPMNVRRRPGALGVTE
jgi:hypothetical protein